MMKSRNQLDVNYYAISREPLFDGFFNILLDDLCFSGNESLKHVSLLTTKDLINNKKYFIECDNFLIVHFLMIWILDNLYWVQQNTQIKFFNDHMSTIGPKIYETSLNINEKR